MIKRILDSSGMIMLDEFIRNELETSLLRMNKLSHGKRLRTANAYKVIAMHGISYPDLEFDIQYGMLEGEKFTSVGSPVHYKSDTLPLV